MTLQIDVLKSKSPKMKPSQELGFGRFFSDHMFLMEYSQAKGWHSAKIRPYGTIPLDPASAVLHYAQTIFEGMKAFPNSDGGITFFRLEFHAKRFQASARKLCMPEVPVDIFSDAVKKMVQIDSDWIPKVRGHSLYIRPSIIATEPFLGVRSAKEFLFFIILSPVSSYYSEGINPVKIWVESEQTRAAPGGLGSAKTGANYAASLHAALDAKNKGFSQVLWLDAVEKKSVEEVGTMNVFFKISNEIITPQLCGTILPGSTREAVIQILRDWNVPVKERPISIEEVCNAHKKGQLEEVFGTGTAAVISPVGELSYKGDTFIINNFKTGDISKRLYNEITGIQYGELKDRFGWLTHLNID